MRKNCGIIVQARMNSSRLPGKVAKKVKGRTLLSYLFERLKQVESAKKIVLATTDNAIDDIVVKEAEKSQIPFFRGSEEDVLDRFYKTAVKFDVDPIVRITADCPMILPDLIDRACKVFLEKKPDYLGYYLPYPEGLADIAVTSFSALKAAWLEACKPSERGHVVTFLLDHPDRFNIMRLKVENSINHFRFTVDEKKDLQVVKHIIRSLYGKPERIFGLKEIEKFSHTHPEIVGINKHIPRNEGYQKSLLEDEEWKKRIQEERTGE